MSYNYSPEYLEHHGIKGQKWGIRRFQNKDGTRTSAGKRRYSEDYTKAHSRKSVKEMSDQELRERNNRLQMEQQYRQNRINNSAVMRGKQYVAAGVAVAAAGYGAYAMGKKLAGTVKAGANFVNNQFLPKFGDRLF
jgi:tetrahydrodipicolinate N-succinyltransferase